LEIFKYNKLYLLFFAAIALVFLVLNSATDIGINNSQSGLEKRPMRPLPAEEALIRAVGAGCIDQEEEDGGDDVTIVEYHFKNCFHECWVQK
jgi:hypothetical protein